MTVKTSACLAFAAALLATTMGWSSMFSAPLQSIMIATRTGPVCFKVEVADTWLSKSKGLMFRATLSSHQGMLFRYHDETPASFWMKYVRFPLDLIFISETGRIVQIHENAQPGDATPIRSKVPVAAVLEIRSGTRRSAQITVGDVIDNSLPDTDPRCLGSKPAQ